MSAEDKAAAQAAKEEAQAKADETLNRMTDPRLYTGMHHYRFDENGKGLGLAGRDRIKKGQGSLPEVPFIRGFKPISLEMIKSSSSDHVPHQDVLNRMTDSKLYTSTHKHRFDKNGRGRGLKGRDRVMKGKGTNPRVPYMGGPIYDMSQVMRAPTKPSKGGSKSMPDLTSRRPFRV